MSHCPRRIAFVTTVLEVGGAERNLTKLALGLDRRQFQPEVYALGPRPAEPRAELVRQLEREGVPTHFIGVRSNSQILTAISRLAGMLRRQQPHWMQSFLFHANTVGTLAARRAGVPHRVMGVRVADPSRWRARVERRLARRADAVVCVSQSVAEHCRRRGYDADKLHVIPNGYDIEHFAAARPIAMPRFGFGADRRVLTFVGRLDRQKGLDWFLPLLPRIFEQAPDVDFLIVGDGPERGDLEHRVKAAGVSHRVVFAGWQPDVLAILAASLALVLPSRWEGMPNVVAEAMGVGLPVICSRADGVEQLLGPLAERQVATFGEADAFVRLITAIVCDDSLRRELGAANRQRLAERFSLRAMIEAFERLYLSLDTASGR